MPISLQESSRIEQSPFNVRIVSGVLSTMFGQSNTYANCKIEECQNLGHCLLLGDIPMLGQKLTTVIRLQCTKSHRGLGKFT